MADKVYDVQYCFELLGGKRYSLHMEAFDEVQLYAVPGRNTVTFMADNLAAFVRLGEDIRDAAMRLRQDQLNREGKQPPCSLNRWMTRDWPGCFEDCPLDSCPVHMDDKEGGD